MCEAARSSGMSCSRENNRSSHQFQANPSYLILLSGTCKLTYFHQLSPVFHKPSAKLAFINIHGKTCASHPGPASLVTTLD